MLCFAVLCFGADHFLSFRRKLCFAVLWKADFQDGEAEEQELLISQARVTRRHALEESSRQFISFIVALQESIKKFLFN